MSRRKIKRLLLVWFPGLLLVSCQFFGNPGSLTDREIIRNIFKSFVMENYNEQGRVISILCPNPSSSIENTCRINEQSLSQIGQLTDLQVLNMYNTTLTTLPPEIGNLTKLNTLTIESDQLTTLPPEIGNLTNLEVLHIQGNLRTQGKLATLPPEIGQLTSLQVLRLSNNNLTSLPPEIGQLTNLEELHLFGNPLTPPAPSRLHGREEILEYLQSFQ